jgi:MGT family glycosyltransferase
MSDYLFLPMPAHGHVNPTLAVAAELTERGHRVTYLLPEAFRGAVEAAGAGLVTFDQPDGGPPRFAAGSPPPIGALMERLLTTAETVAEPLRSLYDEMAPDLVVGETMSLWATMLTASRSAASARISPSYVFGPNSPAMARMAHGRGTDRPPFDVERMAAVARSYGLPGADPGLVWAPGPLTVVMMPAEFHPGRELFDDTVHFVGPALGRQEESSGFPLPTSPALYISLGTVFNDRADFFRDSLDAFGGQERPVVINHGSRLGPSDFPVVPANVTLAPHVPQVEVLARSAAFVTHGGMGSTMEALAAGVPMVVVPQMVEQEVTADRVAELGAGVRLDPADVTPARLAEAVDRVTGDPSFAAEVQRLGKTVREAGGAPAAADLLERAAARP